MSWLRREDLEDLELRTSSPRAAISRRDGERRWPEPDDALRTAFQRDRDRIIHSTAFRRLQHKTQVVAAFEGDHYRTRMTHSLEVSQMARGVSRALGLNADLAEAVALAHDLGHPPFGHVGEAALHELMTKHGGFRHNAQGLRIVDYLEGRYGHGQGLNLTIATRRSLVKGAVPPGFPIDAELNLHAPAPLEARVVDRCDRIAYVCHDLDDGLRAGVFDEREAGDLSLWRMAAEDGAMSASRVIPRMVSLLISDLVVATDAVWSAAADGPPPQDLEHGPAVARAMAEVLEFLRVRFYRSRRVLRVMEDGQRRIRGLFAALLRRPENLPPPVLARIARDGPERTVCDYIAGMTDRFAFARSGG